eukprot:TRINITY_DN6053_c0_g1_i1.p1 TRINITY_DN6053_c0_g1~~TRINITY_DN6053_c0_g1_i1.p1  ORF type:complete len:692 (+),score=151.91 TRINITY_DN6053_c0_g1_i1:77-2152(+)
MSDILINKKSLWKEGLDCFDSVVKKLNERISQYVTVWIDLSSTENPEQKEVILNIVELGLHVTLFLLNNLQALNKTLTAISFLSRPQHDGRVRFIITYEPKSDIGKVEGYRISKLILDMVQAIDKQFKTSPLLVFAPGYIGKINSSIEKSVLDLHPTAILWSSDDEARYQKHKQDSMRFLRFCSGASLMWVDQAESQESILCQVFTDHWIILVRQSNSDAAVNYLQSRTYLKETDNFRIITSKERNGNPNAYLEFIERVRKITQTIPILVYSSSLVYDNLDLRMYNFPRVNPTNAYQDALNVGLMKPLLWAQSMKSGSLQNANWKGNLTIYDVTCHNIEPKDPSGLSDPYITATIGKENRKSKVVPRTLHPKWTNLLWTIPCDKDTEVNISVWDWDLVTSNDFEGQINFKLSSLLAEVPNQANAYIEKTFALMPRKKETRFFSNFPIPTLNQTQEEERVKGTITLVLGFSTGSRIPKHFSKTLKESFNLSSERGEKHIVENCVRSLLKQAISVEGVLRVPGNKASIYRLRDSVEQGTEIHYDKEDPFDIAGLLKLYLYELPDSLFPENIYKEAEAKFAPWKENQIEKATTEQINDLIKTFKLWIKKFPKENLIVWQWLMRLFKILVVHRETTKMTPSAIITSIGPSIFLCPKIRDDPVVFLSATQMTNVIGVFMINNMNALFDVQFEKPID